MIAIVGFVGWIVALRNENGSYNIYFSDESVIFIVALRNENGSYNLVFNFEVFKFIVALRNENGSYNLAQATMLR